MFQIDAMSRVPIYEQLIEQAEKFILTDVLKSGDQIPSVRMLSVNLSVNPITILKAYGELDSRGIIKSVPGRGYFVCENAKEILSRSKLSLLDEITSLSIELCLADIPIDNVIECVKAAYLKGKNI